MMLRLYAAGYRLVGWFVTRWSNRNRRWNPYER